MGYALCFILPSTLQDTNYANLNNGFERQVMQQADMKIDGLH